MGRPAVREHGQRQRRPSQRRSDLHEWRPTHATRRGNPGTASRGLHKCHPVIADRGGVLPVWKRDCGEDHVPACQPHRRGPDPPAPAVTLRCDAPVLDLDPRAQAVSESEPIAVRQGIEVIDVIGWGRVVMGDAHPKGQLGDALNGLLRYPGYRRDRGFDTHVLAPPHP